MFRSEKPVSVTSEVTQWPWFRTQLIAVLTRPFAVSGILSPLLMQLLTSLSMLLLTPKLLSPMSPTLPL